MDTTLLTKPFPLHTRNKRNRNGPQLYTEKCSIVITQPLYHESVHSSIRSVPET